MTIVDRVIFAIIGCALWILILGDLGDSPGAHAQTAKISDRYVSQILHEIVAQAITGEEPSRLEGYDELEIRLQAILSRVVRAMPQTETRISSQEIRSAFRSCRIVGTLSGHTGHLDAKLNC